MKSKYFSKLVLPLSIFCIIFRSAELIFSVEYVAGSYYYKNGSLIPVFFNIFICVCLLFFLTFSILSYFISKNKDNKTKDDKPSKLKSINKTSIAEYILYSLAAVFLLLYGIELFTEKIDLVNFNLKACFSSFTPYIVIFVIFTIIFSIEFAASPKKSSSNKFITILSFTPIILYILIIFDEFINCRGIINNVFMTFDYMLLCSLILSLLCIPKLFLEDKIKYRFLSLSMCSVLLASVKLCDVIMYLLNSINADNFLSFISHLNKIDCIPSISFANFCLALGLLLTATKLFKKMKSNEK